MPRKQPKSVRKKRASKKSAAIVDKSYLKVVAEIKSQIRSAQYRAVLAANQELIRLYWNIGTLINQHAVWGNKFLQNLAADIKEEFPDLKGYSVSNLKYMSRFARLFPDIPIGQAALDQFDGEILQVPLAELGGEIGQAALDQFDGEILQGPLAELGGEIGQAALDQITWYHHLALMSKVKNLAEYKWYASKTAENGWTRDVLVHQIETNLYKRQFRKKKITNFDRTLPKPQSELALQTLKDPYIFDFITFREGMLERDIENALTENITKMLLELGEGFAFVGKQYHLEIGRKDYYIDLLFYNLKLRCYVVIELKTGGLEPEHIGKLNFYLSAVDDIMKTGDDKPTIGILLCKSKNKIIAEYSLRNIDKPIGVSEYKLTTKLPKKLQNILPSVAELKRKLSRLK